jgi:FkbM family methyltransferase
MLPRTFATIAAMIPSRIKYKMSALRRIYTSAMGLGNPVIDIKTAAGMLRWKIDRLTSQRFVMATYEPYMQEAFLSYVRPGSIVYDIGAHAGFHALFCGLLVGPTGKVFAFEPNPENYESIENQISVNPGLPVVVLPCALSDRCAISGLDTSNGSSQGRLVEKGAIEVKTQTIDSLMTVGHVLPPQVIKIDVEGHEGQVIKGSINTLQKYKPVILCDYNDDSTLRVMKELLIPLGFDIITGPPIVAISSNTRLEKIERRRHTAGDHVQPDSRKDV